METYISILRGINVSGHKMIKMDALRKMYEELGFKNVKTYIQSGNVVFQYKKAKPEDLEKKIAKQIRTDFSFEVPVMVKEVNEIEDVIKNSPFVKRKEDVTKLHVTFLSGEPEAVHINKIKEGNYGVDEYILKGNAIYLFCPGGYGNTKLNNNFFENKLKVVATTRNWKTVNELVNIAKEIESDK
jgi:uncharacterized protein (DUF1697 family)